MEVKVEDIKKLREKTAAGFALCKEALAKSKTFEDAIKYVNERGDTIIRLHDLTGAKIGLCKVAFKDAGNDFEKAVEIIKERGWDKDTSVACANPVTGEGVIGVYVHGVDQRTVALAEVVCDTDFVAKNDKFKEFAHNIALQIAAYQPQYISKDDVPIKVLETLKEQYMEEAKAEGKPENILEKIVEGKLSKFYKENCLLEQEYVKDSSKTINELLTEISHQLGERVSVRKILYWKFGTTYITWPKDE